MAVNLILRLKSLINVELQIPRAFHFLFTEDAVRYGIHGGRAAGKSEAVGRFFIASILQEQDTTVAYGCFRETQRSLAESSKALHEGIIKEHGLASMFDISKTSITCKHNGVSIFYEGLLDHTVSRIRSKYRVKYSDVEESQCISQKAIEQFEPTVLRTAGAKIFYKWNDETEDTPIHQHLIVNPPDKTIVRKVSYENNPFLPDILLNDIKSMKAKDFESYRYIYGGEFRSISKNAIFSRSFIDQFRSSKTFVRSNYKQVVIGVDPAKGSKHGDGDEWGIVVVGIDYNGVGSVIADRSNFFTASRAAQCISESYDTYEVDLVIAESNIGGEMIRDIIKYQNVAIPVHLVHATHSKRHRANPVSVNYTKGKISHIGYFSKLEYQMCAWDEDKKFSPDRMDAMVHGFRFLFKFESFELNVTII